jgi:hypothetical protein
LQELKENFHLVEKCLRSLAFCKRNPLDFLIFFLSLMYIECELS